MNPEASAGRWELGLIGHPVGHSLSPGMHEAALEAAAMPGRYRAYDLTGSELPSMFARVRQGEVHGLNVTVPYKVDAAEACDRRVGAADTLGAVNTLLRAPDGALEGHNTDVGGLVGSLRARWPSSPWVGATALVVGAGGAARAATLAALHTGASTVMVMNRTAERADALLSALGDATGGRVQLTPWGSDLHDARLVLQATAMGMGAGPSPLAGDEVDELAHGVLAGCAAGAALMDLVYRPERTLWIAAAEACGMEAAGGLEMLVQQAAAAFELWTGRPASLAAMRRAARAGLASDLACGSEGAE